MQTTQQRAYFKHRQKQRACQRKKQRERKKRQNRQRQEERNLLFRLHKTIDHHFPDLYEKIEAIPECRKQPDYRLVDLIMAGLAMFVFKKGSRNAMSNERDEPKFRKNYERLFKTRLPHMDTVEDVMKVLDEEPIETLKTELVKGLLTKKMFRRYRVLGHSYLVVIDGTHVMNVPEGHCPHCLHQTFKNGTVRYFHNVVEAKLVSENGFCLSLATIWVENPEEYDKQDCEFKYEGECQGCDFFTRLNELGLCEECAGKLERDLIRQRDWDYSAAAFGVPASKREELRRQIVAKYGEKLELIAPGKRRQKNRKSRKRKRRKKRSNSSRNS